MALRFIDGFDHYTTSPQRKWSYSIPTPTITNGYNSQGLSVPNGSGVGYCLDNQATIIVGCFFRIGNVTNSTTILKLKDDGNVQCDVRVNSNATISVTRNGTSLTNGTSSSTINANQWYFIEFKATISNSISASTCVVKVDNATYVDVAAGQSIRSTSNNYANIVELSCTGQGYIIDHLYICDGTGTSNNDFLGTRRVATGWANGDGSVTFTRSGAGASNASMVNEENFDTSNYVYTETTGNTDLYTIGTIDSTSDINGIQLSVMTGKAVYASVAKMKGILRVNSTNYFTTEQYLSDGTPYYSTVYEKNPNTNANWTNTEVNNIQVGIQDTT